MGRRIEEQCKFALEVAFAEIKIREVKNNDNILFENIIEEFIVISEEIYTYEKELKKSTNKNAQNLALLFAYKYSSNKNIAFHELSKAYIIITDEEKENNILTCKKECPADLFLLLESKTLSVV